MTRQLVVHSVEGDDQQIDSILEGGDFTSFSGTLHLELEDGTNKSFVHSARATEANVEDPTQTDTRFTFLIPAANNVAGRNQVEFEFTDGGVVFTITREDTISYRVRRDIA